eukprot:NODE_1781_length_1304_cov_24.638247_g1477_i0.p1 GENE.NODE_1781_length_1304_cov_24.638247_g1477_i0~~NODE_1781_length_1304_cov_24.638247_g1477_i0.p1  ORF type:complete len:328 (+),score=64.71 NODE_1781_length_1304_cov_24.638247_g1477_i0:244-1227(+)
MTSYLLCDDSSKNSRSALSFLGRLIQAGDRVVVYAAVKTPLHPFQSKNETQREVDELRQKAIDSTQFCQDTLLRTTGLPPTAVTSVVEVVDDPREGISHYLHENSGIDIVVVGSRGLGAVKRTVLGSVSDHIVHNSPAHVKILVVHPSADESRESPPPSSPPSSAPPVRYLYCTDGTPASLAAGVALGKLATANDLIDIVTVQDFPHEYMVLWTRGGAVRVKNEKYAAQAAENKKKYLTRLKASRSAITHQGKVPVSRIRTHVIDSPDVREATSEYVSQNSQIDVVVTGTRKLSAAKRILIGSVSTHILHELAIPAVLIVPEPTGHH